MIRRFSRIEYPVGSNRRNNPSDAGMDRTDRTGNSIGESALLGNGSPSGGTEDKEATAVVQTHNEECVKVSASSPPSPVAEGALELAPPLSSGGTKDENEDYLDDQPFQSEIEVLKAEIQKMKKLISERDEEMRAEQEEMKKLISGRNAYGTSGGTNLKLTSPNNGTIELPTDLFTLLMVVGTFENGRPTLVLLVFSCFIMFQWGLCLLIILSVTVGESTETYLGLPTGVPYIVQIGQWALIFLAPLAQTDVFESTRALLLLQYQNKAQWQKVTREGPSFSLIPGLSPEFSLWFVRILVPNAIKLSGALLVLFVTWILIMQSTNILELLKDFTALFILVELDDMMFYVADRGFFGMHLSVKTEKAKQIKFIEGHDESKSYYRLRILALLTIWAVMSAGAGLVVAIRRSGKILQEQFPFCEEKVLLALNQSEEFSPALVGDGICDPDYNIEVCGFDNGDCSILDFYPDCAVLEPSRLGDGRCDFGNYNTPECGLDAGDCIPFENCTVADESKLGNGVCDFGNYTTSACQYDYGDCLEYIGCVGDPFQLGNKVCDSFNNNAACQFDGGDCLEFNSQYPGCNVEVTKLIGDGKCDGGAYNTPECQFDGGDCCNDVQNPGLLGNGFCDGEAYNNPECLYDRGDCLEFNERYPNCTVESPSWVGNGECNGDDYNTPECGFDGGDCVVEGYPDCRVTFPFYIGDGFCDGGAYNTPECGFDGRDCVEFNALYPDCDVEDLSRIGNVRCDGGAYNTEECGFDGGDCVEFNALYPDCDVEFPSRIGDGGCDGGAYNTTECGFDGGDCVEFNAQYLDCDVEFPSRIGNGVCNSRAYNTEECGFDGGDCVAFNALYPDCNVDFPSTIGNGFCNLGAYNTPECGFDGGDCLEFNALYPDCDVDFPSQIGDVDFPSQIGDGRCDGGAYNTPECGFDGGDCGDFNNQYPDCDVDLPFIIGNGFCDGGPYNTPECRFDGGDCLEFNALYPDCDVDFPSWIGDGGCDGGAYNTTECGFDGGDCL